MNAETTGAEAPAAEVTTPATVENAEATTAQQSEAESTGDVGASETTDTTSDEKPKRKHWAHDRIDTLTRQRYEAERQAEYWKQRASQTVDPDTLGYEDGMAERFQQRLRQEQADTAKETASQLAAEAFNYRETIGREKYADYDAVTRNPNVPITPAMAEIIRDSDVGPDLAYHLGKNLTEAARIAALPQARQAAELGRLEERITAPKALPKQPPAPVEPVNAIASGGQKAPEEMTMAEFKAWREANS